MWPDVPTPLLWSQFWYSSSGICLYTFWFEYYSSWGRKTLCIKNDSPSTKCGACLFLVIFLVPNNFLKQSFCGLSHLVKAQLILHISIPDTVLQVCAFWHLFLALCPLPLLYMLFEILDSLCTLSCFFRRSLLLSACLHEIVGLFLTPQIHKYLCSTCLVLGTALGTTDKPGSKARCGACSYGFRETDSVQIIKQIV